MVDIDHHKGALLQTTPYECMLLTQVGEHARAIAGVSKWVSALRGLHKISSQGLQLESQVIESVVELVEISDRDRQVVFHTLQETHRVAMRALMRTTEGDESGLIAQWTHGVAFIPLTEATALVRILHEVGSVRREPRDEHADQIFVPLVMVVDGLIELRDRKLELLPRQRNR
jgi:hypothetical protein